MSAVPALSPERPQTKLERFRAEMLPPDKADEIYRSLPAHVRPERFERNLLNAIMAQPKLLDVDPRLVFREVAKIAALGLILDPQLGECYLIADSRGEVQARVGYRGLIKLARQSGDVEAIYSHDICESDKTHVSLGTDKRLEHEPNFLADRGKQVAFYAVFKVTGGVSDFEIMTLSEIMEIRDRSDAWRAFKANKIKSTPWSSDFGEMAKKTVLRRLLKRAPMSPELADVLAEEDRHDARDARSGASLMPSLASRLAATANPSVITTGFSVDHIADEAGRAAQAHISPVETGEGEWAQPQPEPTLAETGAQEARGETVYSAARDRGRKDRANGVQKRAVPPEYRGDENLVDAWFQGWDEGAAA
jgi:recombination protein RecT